MCCRNYYSLETHYLETTEKGIFLIRHQAGILGENKIFNFPLVPKGQVTQ